jgi:hypothetical protein
VRQRLRRRGRTAAAAGLAAALVPVAAAAAPAPAFRFHDPRITEASGIAVAQRNSGVVFVQNDSGDSARFFAVDERSGATVATIRVRGAHNRDWEDLATAPDADGVPSVWLADIGDNDAQRSEVQLYRVAEPRLTSHRGAIAVGPAQVWRLRYPDGPHDAESLAVTPRGTGYVVTKSVLGSSGVYRVPAEPPARVTTMRRVGTVTFLPSGGHNPFGIAGDLLATGAAMSPDGRLLAIRTYGAAYVWRVGVGGVATALRHAPLRVSLPWQPQGEGVTFAGHGLLVDSEGRGSAVYAVALPARLFARVPSPTAPSSAPSATTAGSSQPTRLHAPRHPSRQGRSAGAIVVGVLILLLLIGTSLLFQRRRRRLPPPDDSE